MRHIAFVAALLALVVSGCAEKPQDASGLTPSSPTFVTPFHEEGSVQYLFIVGPLINEDNSILLQRSLGRWQEENPHLVITAMSPCRYDGVNTYDSVPTRMLVVAYPDSVFRKQR